MWLGTSSSRSKGKLSIDRDEAKRNVPSLSQIPRSLFTEHNKSMVYGKLKANEGRKRREAWAESSDEEYNSDSQRSKRHGLISSDDEGYFEDSDGTESLTGPRMKRGGQLKPLLSPSKTSSPIHKTGRKEMLSTPLSPMSTDSTNSFSSTTSASLLTASVSSASSFLSSASPSPDRGLLQSRTKRESPGTPVIHRKGVLFSGLLAPRNLGPSSSPKLHGIPLGGRAQKEPPLMDDHEDDDDEEDDMNRTSEAGGEEEHKTYGAGYMEYGERKERQLRKAAREIRSETEAR